MSQSRKKIRVKKEEIEEIIFIMDSFNIADKAYREIAERINFLPRMCNIRQRRHELNSTLESKALNGDYKGVYILGE